MFDQGFKDAARHPDCRALVHSHSRVHCRELVLSSLPAAEEAKLVPAVQAARNPVHRPRPIDRQAVGLRRRRPVVHRRLRKVAIAGKAEAMVGTTKKETAAAVKVRSPLQRPDKTRRFFRATSKSDPPLSLRRGGDR